MFSIGSEFGWENPFPTRGISANRAYEELHPGFKFGYIRLHNKLNQNL